MSQKYDEVKEHMNYEDGEIGELETRIYDMEKSSCSGETKRLVEFCGISLGRKEDLVDK